MDKIRVAAVSYLNTKPLLYGIKNHPVFNEIELIEDYPSKIAKMLTEGEVDLGLIPVAATRKLSEWHLVSDYCIGSEGEVASVCIFSDVPLQEIEAVYLDYQSRTSVNLARVLLKEYWKKEVKFIDASGEDFRDQIKGRIAGVVIGDRALEQRLKSRFIFDLGAAWRDYTNMPFVFAAWIANKELPARFQKAFNDANALGLKAIDEVVKQNPFPYFNLKSYYTQYINYNLNVEKRQALRLFLEKLEKIEKS